MSQEAGWMKGLAPVAHALYERQQKLFALLLAAEMAQPHAQHPAPAIPITLLLWCCTGCPQVVEPRSTHRSFMGKGRPPALPSEVVCCLHQRFSPPDSACPPAIKTAPHALGMP